MFKKLTSTLLFAALLAAGNMAVACGWSDDWESNFYRFFDPDFQEMTDYKPFNFTFERLYDYALLEDNYSAKPNIDEWYGYFNASIPKKHIRSLVYGVSAEQLIKFKKSKFNNVEGSFASNSLVKLWKAGKRLEVFDYLVFAHQAEQYCLPNDPWGGVDGPEGDGSHLAEIAVAASNNLDDKFLKLRYAYQAIRLFQYSNHQPEAENAFVENAAPYLNASPTIGEWARCNYAGVQRRQGNEAEAAYQFSKVFASCPSRRIQAWYGWRINSDQIWEEAQSKCKSDTEKATLFFLRAFSPNAISMDDMRQIHELDAENQLLEVLLSREINKLEQKRLGYPFQARKDLGKRLSSDNQAGEELLAFTDEVIAIGKMHDKNVWLLANVYLRFLTGDFKGASKQLTAITPKLSKEGVLKGRLMDLVFRIATTNTVDRSVENNILKDYVNLSKDLSEKDAEELGKFRDEAFAWLYEKQNEPAKALLARNDAWRLTEFQTKVELLNDMLAFEEKSDKTLYEKELLSRLTQSFSHASLLEIKGTRLMAKNLLPEAIAVFKKLPSGYSSGTYTLEADPFVSRTTHFVNCTFKCGEGNYNKRTYAERMLELQKIAIRDPSRAAEAYLQLGNGEYNTTYFGPAHQAKDYYRSGSSWYSLGEHNEWNDFKIETFDEHVDCSLARDYYTKAMLASKDREQGALAAFMIAKCEQNQFYCDGTESMENYLEGFQILNTKYKRTGVYAKMIRECWHFGAYANN